jgi:transcriptional regulator with GAF, ATPase, and Fis domain
MKVDENEFFRQATLKICGNLDMGKALQEFLLYVKQFMPASRILLNLYDTELGIIKTVYLVNQNTVRFEPYTSKITKESSIYLEDKLISHTRIINRPEEDIVTRTQRIMESKTDQQDMDRGEYSAVVVFLNLKGVRIGSVSIAISKRDQYTKEHLKLIKSLNEPFAIALSNALRFNEVVRLKNILTEDVKYLKQELKELYSNEIIGSDFGLKGVMDLVSEVAPLDSPVLLAGETGVGKELIAGAIHTLSKRNKGPYIRVNCGAIPDSLIESELFGHEKGAFTGAFERKRGCFERADKGTIFLDEISELSTGAQIRMLRVLQEKEIIRVGGAEHIPVNFRVIAATNNNLEDLVKQGQFRSDLWFRLHVFPIFIPPLRERPEDISALVNHFIKKKSEMLRLQTPPKLAAGALQRLQSYPWPGNVRELENVVERALILSRDRPLTFNEIALNDSPENLVSDKLDQVDFPKLDSVIYKHIRDAMAISNGKVSGPGGAAELLGVNYGTLRHRMTKLGIHFGKK